jgi:hypothetical protein
VIISFIRQRPRYPGIPVDSNLTHAVWGGARQTYALG